MIKAQYEQLVKRGKEKKVAITACMRKMLTILNAMLREQQPFRAVAWFWRHYRNDRPGSHGRYSTI